MSATIDQKAYLQKYLSGPSKEKKKKKKAIKGKGFKIIDDDIDLSKLRPLDGDEIDLFDEGEDGPQIAGIIDERPEEVKKLEQFKTTSKWKVVTQDDGFNSKLQVEEIKQDIKEIEKENEIIFGKMYSDSEDDNKEDASPSKKTLKKIDTKPQQKRDKDISKSPTRKRQADDSDASPPRKSSQVDNKVTSKKHDSDSDFSPPRKRDRNISKSPERKKQTGNDSDLSPPRKHNSRPKTKQRKPSRWGDFENQIEIKKQNESDSDQSLPRKSVQIISDEQKHRRNVSRSDSDQSPPRKSKKHKNKEQHINSYAKEYKAAKSSDDSPPRKKNELPQRRQERTTNYNYKDERDYRNQFSEKSRRSTSPDRSKKQKRNESDESHRKRRAKSPKMRDESKNRHSDDKNNREIRYESSERRKEAVSNLSNDKEDKFRSTVNRRYSDSDQSPPGRNDKRKTAPSNKNDTRSRKYVEDKSSKMMDKTLEGKKAGLQDARQLREENEQFRRRENEVFNKMADEVSGRNAQVISRRHKRENSEEKQRQKEKAERQNELDAKYQKWNRGLKQIQDQESRIKDFLHESSKPLARFKDDKDLEMNLKDIERDGDPMLKYIRERKRERGDLPPEKPSYKGNFPPNRFNIRPGYRWDGVDRSNGYEKKYFDQHSKRKAQEEEAYKWSTEDL